MNNANPVKVTVSGYCLILLDELQQELGCESRSELVELLVLSQRHSPRDARALLRQRSQRGRRWPIVLPDSFVLPPEG
jgi:hypothetical protein